MWFPRVLDASRSPAPEFAQEPNVRGLSGWRRSPKNGAYSKPNPHLHSRSLLSRPVSGHGDVPVH